MAANAGGDSEQAVADVCASSATYQSSSSNMSKHESCVHKVAHASLSNSDEQHSSLHDGHDSVEGGGSVRLVQGDWVAVNKGRSLVVDDVLVE
eukprot:12719795-Alexandrium_andersonii.AAC.1